MKKKLLTIFLFSTSLFVVPSAFATEKNIEVTPIQNVTGHELAAIYVLSEICPSMVNDQEKFLAGYQKLVAEYLPTEHNPVEHLQMISQQSNFKNILTEAQNDAKLAGDSENQEICEELTAYNN